MSTTQRNAAPRGRGPVGALAACWFALLPAAPVAQAQVFHSAHVDTVAETVTVRGSGLDTVGSFVLGGVVVSAQGLTATTFEIPFDADLASAVQWPGSYRLVADGAAFISVYFAASVEVGGSPPPPPPAGPDCPCIAGWEASGIPQDNFTFCYFDYYSQQQWIAGQRDQWFISAGFDPSDLFFDPADPGNSVSYCALHDGTDWTVAEPLVNQDQFDDCDHWLWVHVCL